MDRVIAHENSPGIMFRPAGVGFSYCDTPAGCRHTDTSCTKSNVSPPPPSPPTAVAAAQARAITAGASLSQSEGGDTAAAAAGLRCRHLAPTFPATKIGFTMIAHQTPYLFKSVCLLIVAGLSTTEDSPSCRTTATTSLTFQPKASGPCATLGACDQARLGLHR